MIIRSAETSDYEAVVSIRDVLALDVSRLNEPGYIDAVERSGFLMPVEIPQDDFKKCASDHIVCELGNKVVGFLRLDSSQEMDEEEVPVWVNPDMESLYWDMPHASIGKIAVLPDAGRRGIASSMLTEAERRAKERGASHLFSFIVTCDSPTNYPSIQFHTRNGFQKMAPLEPQAAYGIPDYVATLYGKKLL